MAASSSHIATSRGEQGAAPDPALERKLASIRGRIDAVGELIGRKVHQRVEMADHYFRANTWKIVGLSAGLAFIAGLSLRRRG